MLPPYGAGHKNENWSTFAKVIITDIKVVYFFLKHGAIYPGFVSGVYDV